MKTYYMQNGNRYKLTDRQKKPAKTGQFFLDKDACKLKKAVAKTVEPYYVYEYDGKGRCFIRSSNDTMTVISDAVTGKNIAQVFQPGLVDAILSALNEQN